MHRRAGVACAPSEAADAGLGTLQVRDLLSTLLSISPIGSTIALRQDPARFRDFDEKVLLGDNRCTCALQAPAKLRQICATARDAGGAPLRCRPTSVAGHSIALLVLVLSPAHSPCHFRKLVAATGWQPTTAFNDTVASVLQYWRREVKVRFELI